MTPGTRLPGSMPAACVYAQRLAHLMVRLEAARLAALSCNTAQPSADMAAARMKAALGQLQQRGWPGTLTQCREVFDELQQFQRAQQPPWAEWSSMQDWGIPERIVAAHAAVRHTTHPGAHSRIGNAQEHGGQAHVAMTDAYLRYYAAVATGP